MFKNQLQEYAQKAGLPAPVYEGEKEGPSHAPLFKASVTVNGEVYESPRRFGSLKKAELAAAEVALAALGKSETGQLLQQESGLFKNLLQEYAQKNKLPLPVYTVVKSGESHTPSFSATVEIAGVCYDGGDFKTKKEAEIRAARTALVAVYPDSGAHPVAITEDQTSEEVGSAVGENLEKSTNPTGEATRELKTEGSVGEAALEPKCNAKRKIALKHGGKSRKLKVKEEQTEFVEKVENMATPVVDSKPVDPCPGTLVDGAKLEKASNGSLLDVSKKADVCLETCADASKQAEPPSPVGPFLAMSAVARTPQLPV